MHSQHVLLLPHSLRAAASLLKPPRHASPSEDKMSISSPLPLYVQDMHRNVVNSACGAAHPKRPPRKRWLPLRKTSCAAMSSMARTHMSRYSGSRLPCPRTTQRHSRVRVWGTSCAAMSSMARTHMSRYSGSRLPCPRSTQRHSRVRVWGTSCAAMSPWRAPTCPGTAARACPARAASMVAAGFGFWVSRGYSLVCFPYTPHAPFRHCMRCCMQPHVMPVAPTPGHAAGRCCLYSQPMHIVDQSSLKFWHEAMHAHPQQPELEKVLVVRVAAGAHTAQLIPGLPGLYVEHRRQQALRQCIPGV